MSGEMSEGQVFWGLQKEVPILPAQPRPGWGSFLEGDAETPGQGLLAGFTATEMASLHLGDSWV